MAGQPQAPSWQPGAQDQSRDAWPQPSFTPPAGSAQDTYAYPQPPAYGQQGQQGQPGQPGQGYPPPTYIPQDQSQGMPQGMPQWQGNPGRPSAAPRPSGEKGFIGSLFDFSFNSMVTPKIVKILYVLLTVWVGLLALSFLVLAFSTGGVVGGLFVLVIADPILILLSLGAYRVVLELCMVIFKLHEDVQAIRARGDWQG